MGWIRGRSESARVLDPSGTTDIDSSHHRARTPLVLRSIDQIVNTETGSYQDLGTRRSAALASYASSGSDFGTTW